MVNPVLERRVALTGSYNFRDLGGLQTTDGRTVRARRLFRSDELHRLTPDDVEILAAFGIVSLLDLRTLSEVTERRAALLFERGVRHHHLPLSDDVALDPERLKALATLPMEEMYTAFLDTRRETVGALFGMLAEESTYPAVVHCAAGKDRTGVVVAVVLRAIGVPDEEIIADYAMTDEPMTKLAAALRAENQQRFGEIPPHLLRALPETMRAFLSRLDAKFGSLDTFLAESGISPSTVEQVRSQLLEPR